MKTLFISPIGKIQNLTPISLAFVKALEAKGLKVGFVKPICRRQNYSAQTYKTLFSKNTPQSIENSVVDSYIKAGEYDQILEEVIGKIDEASQGNDIVVVEGSVTDSRNPFGSNLNVDIARTLCSGIVFAGNAGDNTACDVAEHLDLYARLYSEAKTWFAGYVANKITSNNITDTVAAECQASIAQNLTLIGAIKNNESLTEIGDVVNFIAENLNVDSAINQLNEVREERMPPSAFRYQLIKKARAANKRIVLPEGNEPRTIRAAIICAEKQIARCVLLGERSEIESIAKGFNLTLPDNIEIIDPASIRDQYIEGFVHLRKHRGATEELARAQLQDNVVLGTMMLANDDVDGLVSGAVHTTADTVRPALQLISTDKNSSIVSSVFFMLMPDQVHVYGDCAVNPNPTPEQLADIAIQSAESAKAFGINPRVAMLSYSTGTSGAGEEVKKVAEATELAKAKAPDLLIDGPLQFDSASVPDVGKQKAPNSPVAGKATVFIFPDLNTGNTTYKAVQRSANVISIGPMLQGLRKPVNDLSRGALIDDIVFTIAITALQAIQSEGKR